ncbi:RrF2 family transcriptional regulator [Peptostreptococcus equinus]|uniref:Rrf2 family transcriptional regulator n=1 Tax=Peptostreptococcus equinus TaxID=3003601 RepID=A0ABY7JPS7_9FIRM|nr:Rrf2 family transcriptional regulator [Peptostreptococcus sp. CBA3647]WAW15370.1 Rrf2 family transcriptional regulator [Peptostreptococcus sp. CBA3647]
MKLNKTTDYAVRILIYLTKNDGIITSKELSENTNVSFNYTRKILRKLSENKIISIKRGMSGGVYLKENPEYISLFDVINTMEATFKINSCLDEEVCDLHEKGECQVRKYYLSLQEKIENDLKNMSICMLASEDEEEG